MLIPSTAQHCFPSACLLLLCVLSKVTAPDEQVFATLPWLFARDCLLVEINLVRVLTDLLSSVYYLILLRGLQKGGVRCNRYCLLCFRVSGGKAGIILKLSLQHLLITNLSNLQIEANLPSKAGGLLSPFQVAAAVWQRSIDTGP